MIQLCSLGSRQSTAGIGSPSAGARAERCARALPVTGPPALVRAMVGPALSGRFTPGRVITHRRLTRESARRSPPWRARKPEARESVTRKAPGHHYASGPRVRIRRHSRRTSATDWAQTNSAPGRYRPLSYRAPQEGSTCRLLAPMHRLSSVRRPPALMCRQAQETPASIEDIFM
jgi:hypothetical protein